MANRYTTNPVADLGTVDYSTSLVLQRKLVELVKKGEIGDVLLILDHPPVFTVGRGKKPENYSGVEVVETERGGDVTYHGPGQLVVYPIIDLEKNEIGGARKLVRLIEEVAITSIGKFGYTVRAGDEPGIWFDDKKVASIGLAIRGNVSFHGISINISEEVLGGFAKINPCGLDPEKIGFVRIDRSAIKRELIDNFEKLIHPFEEVDASFFDGMI